jgi:hypothetical protein
MGKTGRDYWTLKTECAIFDWAATFKQGRLVNWGASTAASTSRVAKPINWREIDEQPGPPIKAKQETTEPRATEVCRVRWRRAVASLCVEDDGPLTWRPGFLLQAKATSLDPPLPFWKWDGTWTLLDLSPESLNQQGQAYPPSWRTLNSGRAR